MSGGLSKITGGLDSVFPGLGSLTGQLLGGLEIDLPTAPTGPDKIETGQQVAQKAVGSFDEEVDAKANARRTARKGTSQFRIPLAATASKTGAKTTASSGLKI